VIWTQILTDPTVPIDRATLRLVVDDQRSWTRRWLYPWIRVLSTVTVALVRIVKAVAPFSAHSTMDRLCVWFLNRFVSPAAGTLLIRHFLVESNLLTFLLRNAGRPGTVTLRPTTLGQLGDRAVIEHDRNVYEVLIALGVGGVTAPRRLDFAALVVEPIDAGSGVRRWLNLDIQTALCLMNIPFAFCLTRDEYAAAVHSLRLDDSILALLADLTGDDAFLRWRSGSTSVRMDSGLDVPRAVYEHAVVCELAHGRLLELARVRGMEPGRYVLRYDAPLTSITAPVTDSVPGSARNATTRATSSGVATRPRG
jgi:hypothetical protein